MSKTIHRQEYQVLLSQLKQLRQNAGITQVECSAALGRSQSYVSDVERGVRRLDVIQLRDFCRVLKQDFVSFVREFDRTLTRGRRGR